jgi:hypothetical protein
MKHSNQFARLPRLWLICVAASWVTPTFAQTKLYWTGQSDGNWSNPFNWTTDPSNGNSHGVPQNGDVLYFGFNSFGDSSDNMTNDITGLSVSTMYFGNNSYELHGNSLTVKVIDNTDQNGVANGLGVNSETVDIFCPLVIPAGGSTEVDSGNAPGHQTQTTLYTHLYGPITFAGQGAGLYLAAESAGGGGGGNGNIYVTGVISGNGDVYALAQDDGSGDVSSVEFNGTNGNTFSGTLYVGTTRNAQIIFNLVQQFDPFEPPGFVATNAVRAYPYFFGLAGTVDNISFAAPNQLGDYTVLGVSNGLTLHLSGPQNVTVGSLDLENGPGDTNASTLDIDGIELGLNYNLVSSNASASVIPIIKGYINLNGLINCNITGTRYEGLELAATLASHGGLSISGNNALLLEGRGFFSDPVIINSGSTLDVRTNSALVSSVQLNGGSVTLNSVSIPNTIQLSVTAPNSTLIANGPCSWGGNSYMSLGYQLSVYAFGSLQLNGPITGPGGLTLYGDTITLAGGGMGNTYSGTTFSLCSLLTLTNGPIIIGVNGPRGPLVIGSTNGTPCEVRWLESYQLFNSNSVAQPAVTIYPGGLMNLNGFQDIIGSLTFNGGTVELGSNGVLMPGPVLVNPNSAEVIIEGGQLDTNPQLESMTPPSYVWTVDVENASLVNVLTINSTIGGGIGITKVGPGYLALTGNNSFTGHNSISNGNVIVYSPTALGNVFNTTTVEPGGALVLETNVTIEPMLINNGGVLLEPGITLELDGGLTNSDFVAVYPGATLLLGGGGTSGSTSNSIIVGAGNLLVEGPGNFAGTVNVAGSNIFNLTGLNVVNLTGDYICTNNALIIEGGTANFDGTGIVSPSILTLSGGTLGGAQTVSVGNSMSWTGGSLSGTGRTLILPGASLTVNNLSTFNSITSRTLDNGGTTTWAGASLTMNGGVITNEPGALFQVQSPALIIGSSRLDNAGTLLTMGSGTNAFTGVALNNFNLVEVQGGTLALRGGGNNAGTISVPAGTTLSYAGGTFTTSGNPSVSGAGMLLVSGVTSAALGGTMNVSGPNIFSGGSVDFTGNYTCTNTMTISGGTVSFDGTGTVSPSILNLSGGTLGGAQTVTARNSMSWIGGSMSGTGRTLIPTGASLTINYLNLSFTPVTSRTLDNGGTATWAGASISMIGGVITNEPGALFQVQSPGSFNFGGGSERFDNAGTFRKSVTPGTFTFTVPLNNNGTVDIETGTLFANGGGYAFSSNSVLNCAVAGTTPGTNYGQLQVGGSVSLNGTLSVKLINNYIPTTNNLFTLVTAGTLNGAFSNFIYPSNKVAMVLSNTATAVIATVTGVHPLPAQPVLHLDRISTTSGLLYWSTNFPNYHLEYNPSFGATNWAASGLTPVVVATNFFVTNSLSSPQKFYRLSSVAPPYTPPAPALKIERISPSRVRMLWPTDNDRPFTLLSTTNLTSPNWLPVSPSPSLLGANNVVTNAISGTGQFYRLSNQ